MKVWFIDVVATDGYMCTEGPFISKDYVMSSKDWTFNKFNWREAHDSDIISSALGYIKEFDYGH